MELGKKHNFQNKTTMNCGLTSTQTNKITCRITNIEIDKYNKIQLILLL